MVNARALYAGCVIIFVGLVTPAIGQTEAEILLRDSFQTAVANGRSTKDSPAITKTDPGPRLS